jgi:hypothetical protein
MQLKLVALFILHNQVIEQLQSVTLASPNAAIAATPAPGSSKQRQHRSSRDAPAIDVTDISPPKVHISLSHICATGQMPSLLGICGTNLACPIVCPLSQSVVSFALQKVKLDGESSPGEQEPQQADPPEMQQRWECCPHIISYPPLP